MEKHYDFKKVEKQMQEFWEQNQVYRFDKNAEGDIYSIDTPPPTVSGSLHIGHLFSYTQAEIIARFHRMQGQNVFYPFGFDDNGLPTERLVKREEGIRAGNIPRSEFNKKCQSIIKKYENEFKEFWKSLGFSVDWESEYKTINPEVQKISQELFLKLVKTGKAYTKESPVLWCVECKTSIAQAELDSFDIESAFNYIPFFIDGKRIEAATTRPELLYGCTCLFVNPNDGRYRQYAGKTAVVPLYNYEIPVLFDEKVDIDKGTGIVMCATFGDSTDMEWFIEHNLPYRKVILPNGNIDDDVPFINGLNIADARKKIINLLDEKGLLIKSEKITHTVSTHERCGKPIEIIPSRQWYIDILSERERFLKAADEINWYPASMKKRYIAWVENLKWDWCISRQRYFGVPFPVWYCKECGCPVFAKTEQLPVNPLETEYNSQGISPASISGGLPLTFQQAGAKSSRPVETFGLNGICKCGCTSFIPESAVFDTWVTSSITPQINERLGLPLTPMSMRTHAHEIIRTWTFYSIVRSLYHTGDIPWKDLMICGFILAKKGEKISKSKNNNDLDPKYLIDTHSADALRYWTAGARLGTDVFFSADELAVPKRFITKLWNASKFSVSHLQDIDLTQTPELLPVDRWILERVGETTANAVKLLDEYEIGSAKHEIDNLFWKDFCDNYIEIVKERLYKPDIHGADGRKSGQYALYYTLLEILKLYSVYIPHLTEYIYQEFYRQHEKQISIHLTWWNRPSRIDNDIIGFGEKLKSNIFEMRKYKSERNLSMRDEIDILEIQTPECFESWFKQTEKDISACSKASKIKYIIK